MTKLKKIGYVQTSPVFGDKAANFRDVEHLVKNLTADLLVLPELFATGYAFQSTSEATDVAEGPNGETAIFLQNLAQSTGAIVVGGFVEQDQKNPQKIFNSAMMVSDQEILGIYQKTHLFYKEKLWFSPGESGFGVIEARGMKIGMMICFDWIFPESVRTLALHGHGAEIIAHPANLVLPYCQQAMITRCLCNKVIGVTANRIGTEIRGEDAFTFTGASQITSEGGDVLFSAPVDQTAVDIIQIDPTRTHDKKLNSFNDLHQDRRVSMYKK
ncbi:MAG: nitrilase-related carbon-nitrogen hydrolase [Promethearchaeota archaeon]